MREQLTSPRGLWSLLLLALLIRLISLGSYPLMDTTEARYGEMARLMLETNNWLTPQFDYGVPFWGKPPLFTWMSALSAHFLGVSEFSLRFPHWVAAILVLMSVAHFARRMQFNIPFTLLVICSCGIFYLAAGAVMTDMALTFAMTLTMLGFYQGYHGDRKMAWLGFVGLGIGLLAKGPIILVLTAIVIFPWLLLQKRNFKGVGELFKRIPVLRGLFLMSAIAAPWYLLAEMATPGFIDYFLVGEHFKRFMISGWQGDLYGSAHDQPRGTIWLFWIGAAFPWSLLLVPLLWRWHKSVPATKNQSHVMSFLLLWLISPMLLFSLSGNILAAYVLPGLPALGLLVALLYKQQQQPTFLMVLPATILPILVAGYVSYLQINQDDSKTDKFLMEQLNGDFPAFYVGKRPFSGQFYSKGQVKVLTDNSELKEHKQVQLIGHPKDVANQIQKEPLNCREMYTARSGRILYQCHR